MLQVVDLPVLEREVVHPGDVPYGHDRDVEERGECRVSEEPGTLLDPRDTPRHRTQQPLGEAQDQQDRHDVEQQHVLDHVHEHDVVGDRIDR